MFCLAIKRAHTPTVHTNTPTLDSLLPSEDRKEQSSPTQFCYSAAAMGPSWGQQFTTHRPPFPRVFPYSAGRKTETKKKTTVIADNFIECVCVCRFSLYLPFFLLLLFTSIIFYFSPPTTAELWAFFPCGLFCPTLSSFPYLTCVRNIS